MARWQRQWSAREQTKRRAPAAWLSARTVPLSDVPAVRRSDGVLREIASRLSCTYVWRILRWCATWCCPVCYVCMCAPLWVRLRDYGAGTRAEYCSEL